MIWSKKASGAAQARALVNPAADFLLVGGAGILTFFMCVAMYYMRPYFDPWFHKLAPGVSLSFNASVIAAYLAFAVNFPHFAYSYLLFYPGYFNRLTGTETTLMSKIRLSIAGILVPLAMAVYFAYAFQQQDSKFLGWGVKAMVFTVGWHYVKQGYGVLITLSLYKSVFYNEWEKRILYVNGYLVWIYTWCRTNSNAGVQAYYDIEYHVSGYPEWLVNGTFAICMISTAAAAAVLIKHWLRDRKGISTNGVLGYFAAIYLWVLLPYMNDDFYMFIPLFHSLQYFPFVYKYKKSEFTRDLHAPQGDPKATRQRAFFWAGLFTLAGFALGALFFNIIPNYMDVHPWIFGDPTKFIELDANFFIIAFIVFINVHHFFIDSAFWRRDNAKVQQYLFRA
jgi:hypothetical protein